MPQISGDDYKQMLKVFDEYDIPYKKGRITVSLLKPVQEDAIPEKVERITKAIEESGKILPIIICNDNWIIDGHHRWIAIKKMYGDDKKIPAIKILLPKKDAWKLLHTVSNNT